MSRAIGLFSLVIPCHNEEESLPLTYPRVSAILKTLVKEGLIRNYELLFVNNGSKDKTQQLLEKFFSSDPHVRILELRRNFGYQGSISAGLFEARGDAVVTIDADLQDPPEKIPEMILAYRNGYDLVLGVRSSRQTDSWFKRVFSQQYYRILRWLAVEVVYNHGDYRLMARPLVEEFKRMAESNRFIRAMILQLDDRYAVVEYERTARQAGKTKFNLQALFSLSFDGIMSFSYKPLRVISLLGLFMCLIALAGVIWVFYTKMRTNVVPGWASTMLPIFIFGGIQTFFLGIIGEYIGRLYVEVKHRPLFSVRKDHRHE